MDVKHTSYEGKGTVEEMADHVAIFADRYFPVQEAWIEKYREEHGVFWKQNRVGREERMKTYEELRSLDLSHICKSKIGRRQGTIK